MKQMFAEMFNFYLVQQEVYVSLVQERVEERPREERRGFSVWD